MEDDLDDLLDEVEHKYLPLADKRPPKASLGSADTKLVKRVPDDMDRTIEELLADDDHEDLQRISKPSVPARKPLMGREKKCHPYILLGGSLMEMGWNDSNSRACDSLRCVSCDMNVIWLDNHQWSKQTDYLFLRNNFPNRQKLRANLVYSSGFRAYACQCSWHSIYENISVSNIANLKWFCNRH